MRSDKTSGRALPLDRFFWYSCCCPYFWGEGSVPDRKASWASGEGAAGGGGKEGVSPRGCGASTASGARAIKDQQSNFNQGLNREITITAEDGREIYHYTGKCDIETQDRYILFEGDDGLRRTIYWGITDTIIIEETGQ